MKTVLSSVKPENPLYPKLPWLWISSSLPEDQTLSLSISTFILKVNKPFKKRETKRWEFI